MTAIVLNIRVSLRGISARVLFMCHVIDTLFFNSCVFVQPRIYIINVKCTVGIMLNQEKVQLQYNMVEEANYVTQQRLFEGTNETSH